MYFSGFRLRNAKSYKSQPQKHSRIVGANDVRKQLRTPLAESEVGGSEFAFRQAPPNREIVSCRACVRAVWLPSHIPGQIQGVGVFPFPFWLAGLSLFPFVIGFPFSLVP